MESIELNSFVKAVHPEISKFPIRSYDPEEAEDERLGKDYLMRDVFMHLGPENHMQIVSLLKNKCFSGIKEADLSRHIMYRVMNGTMVNSRLEHNVEFIYDMHDRAAETILSYIAFADSFEKAQQIINAIDVNFDNQ